MSSHSIKFEFGRGARLTAVVCIAVGLLGLRAGAQSAAASGSGSASGASSASNMGGMGRHMYMTTLRPIKPGDRAKADAIVAAAKEAMEPYKDYHKALADGYVIFLPNIRQPQYHFTKGENAREALTHFDPLKPTSLLYKKTTDGGYTLVGAMYTDRVTASEEEINERVPLSIARWHQHVNFCKAPPGHLREYFGKDAKFGMMGSINTREACDAAGGTFLPHVFGWMVHVYPYETDPAKVWSVDDDGDGHDNMDHSAMPPGMKMN
ncbi:MAG: hypothetical protein ABR923_15220 [Terracidiphilus sp.]|jgi:hypothetical protein